jgi:hypothetical protein
MANPALTEKLRAFFAPREEVLEAYLFGSMAAGLPAAHSDVDVAVYLRDPRPSASSFGYPADLAASLMQLIGTNDVDVVVLNDAPPLLYHRVLRDGVRILARDLRATTVREGQALSRYCDFLPQLRKIDAAHQARMAGDRFGR